MVRQKNNIRGYIDVVLTFQRIEEKKIPRPVRKFLEKFFDGKTNEAELTLLQKELAELDCCK